MVATTVFPVVEKTRDYYVSTVASWNDRLETILDDHEERGAAPSSDAVASTLTYAHSVMTNRGSLPPDHPEIKRSQKITQRLQAMLALSIT